MLGKLNTERVYFTNADFMSGADSHILQRIDAGNMSPQEIGGLGMSKFYLRYAMMSYLDTLRTSKEANLNEKLAAKKRQVINIYDKVKEEIREEDKGIENYIKKRAVTLNDNGEVTFPRLNETYGGKHYQEYKMMASLMKLKDSLLEGYDEGLDVRNVTVHERGANNPIQISELQILYVLHKAFAENYEYNAREVGFFNDLFQGKKQQIAEMINKAEALYGKEKAADKAAFILKAQAGQKFSYGKTSNYYYNLKSKEIQDSVHEFNEAGLKISQRAKLLSSSIDETHNALVNGVKKEGKVKSFLKKKINNTIKSRRSDEINTDYKGMLIRGVIFALINPTLIPALLLTDYDTLKDMARKAKGIYRLVSGFTAPVRNISIRLVKKGVALGKRSYRHLSGANQRDNNLQGDAPGQIIGPDEQANPAAGQANDVPLLDNPAIQDDAATLVLGSEHGENQPADLGGEGDMSISDIFANTDKSKSSSEASQSQSRESRSSSDESHYLPEPGRHVNLHKRRYSIGGMGEKEKGGHVNKIRNRSNSLDISRGK